MSLISPQAQKRLFLMGFALFLSYLCVAIPLSALSLHVTAQLGLSNWLGGLAVGSAFISTLISRPSSGRLADRHGGKLCTFRGLLLYIIATAVCLLSAWPTLPAIAAYVILIIGRLILGLGESYALVGIISWNIGLLGPQNSGRVMAIIGMAMYGAFAVGGPLGLALYHYAGFPLLMGTALILPLAGWIMLRPFPETPPQNRLHSAEPFIQVMRKIWPLGTVVGLQGVGFAVLGAFIPLYFLSRGWPHAGLGLTCFGVAFVCVRLCFGSLPDKIGGIKVAVISVAIEALGQYLLWISPNVWLALFGALLTGLGCSMVFPSMGVEVVKRVTPESRSTALGGFSAFQDIAYAFSGPIAGLLADRFGYPSTFLLGALAATLAIIMIHVANTSRKTSP